MLIRIHGKTAQQYNWALDAVLMLACATINQGQLFLVNYDLGTKPYLLVERENRYMLVPERNDHWANIKDVGENSITVEFNVRYNGKGRKQALEQLILTWFPDNTERIDKAPVEEDRTEYSFPLGETQIIAFNTTWDVRLKKYAMLGVMISRLLGVVDCTPWGAKRYSFTVEIGRAFDPQDVAEAIVDLATAYLHKPQPEANQTSSFPIIEPLPLLPFQNPSGFLELPPVVLNEKAGKMVIPQLVPNPHLVVFHTNWDIQLFALAPIIESIDGVEKDRVLPFDHNRYRFNVQFSHVLDPHTIIDSVCEKLKDFFDNEPNNEPQTPA